MSRPLITLTTDFGTADPYVAIMKGVILGINQNAQIVDLSHSISPQDVSSAAFIVGTAYRHFPPDTVHVIVVDPGVGSARRLMLMDTDRGRYLAPDNGSLSYILRDGGAMPSETTPPFRTKLIAVPEEWRTYAITNDKYWIHPVSNTFHGRDIFAPVAAHLTLGTSPELFGERVREIVSLVIPQPKPNMNDGTMVGLVAHVDRFGNLITNIPSETVSSGNTIVVAGHHIKGLSSSYSHSPDLMAIIGSHGYIEISIRNGNAAELIMASVGQEVAIISATEQTSNVISQSVNDTHKGSLP